VGLLLNVRGMTAQGPFDFVAAVGDVSVDTLKRGLPAAIPASQSDVVGQTVTVVSQSGADGKAGPAGAPGSTGASVEPDLDGLYATDVASESLLKEVLVDFASISAGALSVSFSAFARALGGATGTFRLRLGGTDGVADGTLVGTLTASSTSYQMLTASGSVANPLTRALVKLCGLTSVGGLDAQLKSAVARFAAS
jgi:hypothetical protein